MSGTIMPSPWFTGLDDNGVSLVGGKLYTYVAGASTPQATYADVDLLVPNANPVILDGGGRATVYLSANSYKFVLKDENDVTIRTQDNISATAPFNTDVDIAGVAGENLPAGSVVYLSVGAGGQTAGRWYLADADLDYASEDADFIAMVQTAVLAHSAGSFRLQGRTTVPGPLVPGATYYVSTVAGGLVTPAPVPPAFTRVVGIADSLNTIVSATGFGASTVIGGNVNVSGDLTVSGGTLVGGQLGVNGDLVFAGNNVVRRNTLDGADTGVTAITGGGEAGVHRGAYLQLFGNESTGPAGIAVLGAGDVPTGHVQFYTGTFNLRMIVFHTGGVTITGNGVAPDPGSGNLLVGSQPFVAGNTCTQINPGTLQIANTGVGASNIAVLFANDNGVVGNIATVAAQTNYGTTSDARLKTDLGVVTDTRILSRLVIHDFQWKADGTVGRGLFAQEAVEVLPSAVSVGCDGPVVDEPWQVDYSKVVPDLIVGWQAHEARIISLLERLERLESRHDGN